MTPNDTEAQLHALFVRGLEGDAAAYHECLRRIGAHLRAWLGRKLFGWPDDVEDLVQDCLLAMHLQRHTYQPAQPLTAWVHAIARHKLIDLLRAKSAREALHEELDDELPVFAASDTQARETRRDLDGLLASLPERHRLPIVHVKLEGRSVAEAARLTGMSEAAVKVGIHRGIKALASRLAAREIAT
ncbi:sigma-70 family RNA polymerase sigma factor [Ramlibacter rhizophilus]|uniref:Sigma-70 family RNA polymerase sigma factor n=1 Tax=Ramlibacter rhizophilus TaxID=1781167 RepID=A0A4Z0BVF4_9BURK|nr:sigma-70 family RNA polymerase sigma factor [Ramlibacter rhizophilus]TFZ03273.1 sigma-70 family RNA polymerase sigma factor [Ramlibacter rhizophilus]